MSPTKTSTSTEPAGFGRWFAIPLVFLLAQAGCSKDESPGSSGHGAVLARVNDSKLTEGDLERLIPAEYREAITGQEVRDILERWVRDEILYQKAKQDRIDRDLDVAFKLHELRRDVLAEEVLQRELDRRVAVNNEEIQAYYDAHLPEFTQQLHLKHIVLNTREEAEEVLQQLRNGVPFEKLARLHSIDASATKGGDLGYLGRGEMNPAFEPHVFDLEASEVKGPIASSFGFHLVQVAGKRRSKDPVLFDAARDEIMHILLLQKQQKAQEQFLRELRASSDVHIADSYDGMPLASGDVSSTDPPRSDEENR